MLLILEPIAQCHVGPLSFRYDGLGVVGVCSITDTCRQQTSVVGEEGQHVVLGTHGEDGAVGLAIEPETDGEVGVGQFVGGLGPHLIHVELQGHVGEAAVESHVVHVAVDGEVVALAQ